MRTGGSFATECAKSTETRGRSSIQEHTKASAAEWYGSTSTTATAGAHLGRGTAGLAEGLGGYYQNGTIHLQKTTIFKIAFFKQVV